MLESISWTKFLEGVAIAFTCYYAGLALAVYRKQIVSYVHDPKAILRITSKADAGNVSAKHATPMAILHEITSILEQAGNPADKNQLLAAVKSFLHHHKQTSLPAYRVPVQDYIISKSEEICGVRITAADLESED